MIALYDRVALRCASAEIPVTAACIADIDRMLREERRAEAYDRAGLIEVQCGGCAPPVLISGERPL
jgi:hypothetical protein